MMTRKPATLCAESSTKQHGSLQLISLSAPISASEEVPALFLPLGVPLVPVLCSSSLTP